LLRFLDNGSNTFMSLAMESALGPRPSEEEASPARRAVAGEVLRAAANALLLPLRSAGYLARARSLRRGLAADLERARAVEDAPPPSALPGRPLRLFVASAEPSGERHAVRLIGCLREELARAGAPAPEILALGGARTRALGVETVGDPLARAAMGLDPLRSLPFYARLLARTGDALARFRPDLVVPVDSPALFVPLARIARRAGLRSAHFVAPQYWAWAPWRVRAYREAFGLALTILPFEPGWFERHGVRTAHVGHPALDGLAPAPPGDDPGRKTLVLLPGSRSAVIARNLPWMLGVARELQRRHPSLAFVLANEREDLRAELVAGLRAAGASELVRLALGDLHSELARARAALTVSGTVLIDLLHHRLPAAVVYRVGSAFASRAAPHLLSVPWFSSVNLLARAPVYWEACFHGEGPRAACLAHLEQALFESGFRERQEIELDAAAARLGPSGATPRAARHLLRLAAS
jgi:lipid-A-disaccharide synthase